MSDLPNTKIKLYSDSLNYNSILPLRLPPPIPGEWVTYPAHRVKLGTEMFLPLNRTPYLLATLASNSLALIFNLKCTIFKLFLGNYFYLR